MVLCVVIKPSEANFLWRFPPLIAGLPYLINDCVSYLMYDFLPIDIYDPEIEEFEQSTVEEITRAISSAVLFCIQAIREILVGGVKTIVILLVGTLCKKMIRYWPALPWTVVCSAVIILEYALKVEVYQF